MSAADVVLFRLTRLERLEAARKWVGATVDVIIGREPHPDAWTRYHGVTVVAVAVPLVGTVADVVVLRRTDGRAWSVPPTNRQRDEVAADTVAVSLAELRSIRPAFT